jgi:hypothetical protein
MSRYGYTLLAEAFPAAKKAHRCIWCGESIPIGEKHRHEKSIYCGTFQDHRWHLECRDAANAELFDQGEEEFAPFDNERPVRAATSLAQEVGK